MATSMSIRFQWGRRARLLSLHSSACSPDSCATSTSLFLVTALLVVLCCMLSGKNYKCFVFPPYSQLSRRLTMYHCSIHVSTSVQNKLAGWDWQMWSLQARRVKSQVYLQQIKKKAKAEGKTCHAKTMLSLEQPIKLLWKTPHMCRLGKSPRSKYEGRS